VVNEERLIALFRELCLIDAPALQERQSVDFGKRLLTEMGLEVYEDKAGQEIGGNAGNLYATLKGNVPGAPRIYFSAHFDTVEPTAGLEIEEVDGVFRSKSDTILGADDKAGMAPIIEAVRVVQEKNLPHGDIVLLLTVAEEIGLKGAGALKIEDLNLDYGYVLDTGPPVGSFVNRTAYHDKIDFTVVGRPAHAGKHPEEGINAICVAADAISRFKVGRIDEETTSNLGFIEGGSAVNVVCPSVKIRGEARSTSLTSLDRTIDTMVQAFEQVCQAWGAELIVDHRRHYNAYEIDPNSEVVQVAQKAARNMGYDGALRTTLGGSDANQFNVKGVPSIVVATGMSEIHTHDEYVSREDLIKTTELVLEIIAESVKSRA